MHRGEAQYFLYVQCSIASMFNSFNEGAPKKAITRRKYKADIKLKILFRSLPTPTLIHFYISMMDLFS
jgi:hypothetical protein